MRDRKSSIGRQQGDVNRGLRQQSQESNRDGRQQGSGGSGSRKQKQTNRMHRTQQR